MLRRTPVVLRVRHTPRALLSAQPVVPRQPSWEEIVSVSFFESSMWAEEDYMGRVGKIHCQVELSILMKAFTEYDLDGNGVLDKEEIGAALDGLSLDSSPAAVDAIFAEYDTNNDGVISLEEWLTASTAEFRSAVLCAFKAKCP